jgi:hypothetical protein
MQRPFLGFTIGLKAGILKRFQKAGKPDNQETGRLEGERVKPFLQFDCELTGIHEVRNLTVLLEQGRMER